jgi:hypothetical protein
MHKSTSWQLIQEFCQSRVRSTKAVASQIRDKSERIWTVEARGDLDRFSSPTDLMRENLGHLGFESLEHGGGCLPKSRNHEM